LHALRQYRVVQNVDLPVHALEHARGIFAAAHQREAFDYLALVVPTDRAAPRRRRERDARDVSDRERQAVAGLERHFLQVLGRVDEADPADRELLIAVPQETAADIY